MNSNPSFNSSKYFVPGVFKWHRLLVVIFAFVVIDFVIYLFLSSPIRNFQKEGNTKAQQKIILDEVQKELLQIIQQLQSLYQQLEVTQDSMKKEAQVNQLREKGILGELKKLHSRIDKIEITLGSVDGPIKFGNEQYQRSKAPQEKR